MQGLARLLLVAWNVQRANVAILLGRRTAAMAAYGRILQCCPDHADARMVLGNWLAEADDKVAAIEQFRCVVEHDKSHADAWFNLGFLHEERGELAAAEACLRQALELNPQFDRAWYGLGLVRVRSGHLDEAVLAFQRNVKLQPFSPDGYCQLAMSLQRLGRTEAAHKVLHQLQGFEPNAARALARDLESAQPAVGAPPSPAARVA
ncbi:MAG: tetratricopeptide repeat protein [Burkholderiaceae bacterium]